MQPPVVLDPCVAPVDIVILHAHFQRGGVTQVVENHVAALAASSNVDRILLVSGERRGGLSAATLERSQALIVPGIDYDPDGLPGGSAPQRAAELSERLSGELAAANVDRSSSVLHWHNHSLGKNTATPQVVRRLAQSGWRFLLQIHDFAEDYRPENYQRLIAAAAATTTEQLDEFLYPLAPQIHYAALTGGDAAVLAGLGVATECLHRTPNSVTLAVDELADREYVLTKLRRVFSLPEAARWCLYPVRGIRRKNVAEFLLVCRWLADDCFGGLTLRPTTPLESRSYDRWRRLAAEVSPQAVFDAGEHQEIGFTDNLAAADLIVSTSVAEGFGMAFLEPWLASRGVVARRLPGVTDDFTASGVELSALYDRIPIPGDADWLSRCRHHIEDSLRAAWKSIPTSFHPPTRPLDEDSAETIDFARLTPGDQIAVLQRAANDRGFESVVRELSSPLIESLHNPPDAELVDRNANVIRREYSVAAQGRKLSDIYQRLLSVTIDPNISGPSGGQSAVDLVTRARCFYACRTERNIEE